MKYHRTTLLLVTLAAGAVFAAPSAIAQTAPPTAAAPKQAAPPSEAALKAVRTQIAQGKFDAALASLKGMPDVAPVLRLRIDAAIGAGDFPTALTSLDTLNGVEKQRNPALLAAIARGVIERVGSGNDPVLKFESCKVLLSHGKHACAKDLAAQARSEKEPLPGRLRAAATLAAHGDRDALALFRTLAGKASGRNIRAVLTAARDLPPALAVQFVVPALSAPDADIQFSAASLLGDLPSPESRAALTRFLATGKPGPARTAAWLSLAALGDETQLKDAIGALNDLQGGDLLRVGVTLLKRNDPRGVEALTRALQDDRELTRIAAAAALGERKPDLAKPVLIAALSNFNPLIRAAALEEFRGSPLLPATQARGVLLDSDPFVRLRAADALLTRLTEPEPRRQ